MAAVRIHSPGHWLAWKTGMAPARAAALVTVAERRAELPTAVSALVAGELSADAAIEVARRAPASHERSITEFASEATISQLRRTLRDYAYDADTEDRRPRPAEETRSFTMGTDHLGWWCRGRLPVDEGAVVETAVRTARDDRFRQLAADRPADGEAGGPSAAGAATTPPVDLADGLLAVAEAALVAGTAAHPGTDRYRVHLHLHHPSAADADADESTTKSDTDPGPDAGPGAAETSDGRGAGGAPVLAVHLGPVLPTALRQLLTCDGGVRPVHHVDGVPVSVGRRRSSRPACAS